MPDQRRNIMIYVAGIMCYKFGIEYFNGAFLALANERFGEARYEKLGLLTGLNYAAQGIGSIAIAPLVKRMPIRIVLMGAIIAFGVVSAMIMIVDATTGGKIKFKTANDEVQYGSWNPNLMFPIFTFSGLSYGMVELIRRVIPRDIVGGDPARLKKMDGLVHVLYEVAGTIGALTSERLIDKFGYNYSSFLSPPLFCLAGAIWWFLDVYKPNKDVVLNEKVEYDGKRASPTSSVELIKVDPERSTLLQNWQKAFHGFIKAFYYGAWLCFTHRKFIWLIPSYTFALYGHRYLENGVVQIYAKSVLGNSGLAQVIVGGSNLGELLGAASVMLFTQAVPTPIPWLRMDAMTLNLIWIIPFFTLQGSANSRAWKLAPCMIPISYGWAGGDVSLAAYIQSTLSKLEQEDDEVSALGAVMAFLYVTYIVLYSVLSTQLGRWIDKQLRDLQGDALVSRAQYSLKMIGGVHFTVLSLIIFTATFIPRGAVALNPKNIEQKVPGDPEKDDRERPVEDTNVPVTQLQLAPPAVSREEFIAEPIQIYDYQPEHSSYPSYPSHARQSENWITNHQVRRMHPADR